MKLTANEKWLFAAPALLLAIVLGGLSLPAAVRKITGAPQQLPISGDTFLTSISLSADGKLLAAGEGMLSTSTATTNIIDFWDARTLQPLPPLTRPRLKNSSPPDESTPSVTLSPDGKILAWCKYGYGTTFYDLQKERILWVLPGVGRSTVFSPDSKWVAFGSHAPDSVREARTGRIVQQWNDLDTSPQCDARFSPQGTWYAKVRSRFSFSKWLRDPLKNGTLIDLYQVKGWKRQRTLDLPNALALDFSPDERSLVAIAALRDQSASFQGSRLRLFDTKTGKLRWELDSRQQNADPQFKHILDALFTPDGQSLIVRTTTHLLQLGARDGHIIRTFSGFQADSIDIGPARSLAITPDGKRLFVRGGKAVRVWELE